MKKTSKILSVIIIILAIACSAACLTGCNAPGVSGRKIEGYLVDEEDYPSNSVIYLDGRAFAIEPIDVEKRLEEQTAIESDVDWKLKGSKLTIELPNVYWNCVWMVRPNYVKFVSGLRYDSSYNNYGYYGYGKDFFIPGKSEQDYPDVGELLDKCSEEDRSEGRYYFPKYAYDEEGKIIKPWGLHYFYYPRVGELTRYIFDFGDKEVPDVIELRLMKNVMGPYTPQIPQDSEIASVWYCDNGVTDFYRLRIYLNKRAATKPKVQKAASEVDGHKLDKNGNPLTDKVYINGNEVQVAAIDIKARAGQTFALEEELKIKMDDSKKLTIDLPNICKDCKWLIRPNVRYLDRNDAELVKESEFMGKYTRFEFDFAEKKTPRFIELTLVDIRVESFIESHIDTWDYLLSERTDIVESFRYFCGPAAVYRLRILID